MKIESKLILTSKNSVTDVNLYTFVLVYPRIILSEVNTHRALSRNTSSSRAIPAWKQRSQVLHDAFVPISLGKNIKGMQAGEELEGWRRFVAIQTWKLARYPSVLASWILEKVGAHKQVVNRIVEPWTWTQQIMTATDLNNVFKLRNHPDAEPHIHELARQMQEQVKYVKTLFDTVNFDSRNPDGTACALDDVNPTLGVGRVQMLKPGFWGPGEQDWHLPFINQRDIGGAKSLEQQEKFYDARLRGRRVSEYIDDMKEPIRVGTALEALKKISTARCARTSYYLPEDGAWSTPERDLGLCDSLSSSGHWSPFEHVATPVAENIYIGNFRSWKQYRKDFQNEAGGDR